MSVTVFSPAKLNLLLAITGRRPDGFHDLVSLVSPVEFGDELTAELDDAAGRFTLECEDKRVPCDDSNLVLRAAALFAERTGWRRWVRFKLEKRIPMGAGLGGGSSNAVAALRALNSLADEAASEAVLAEMAGELGSDCVLFLRGAPVVMRGRGERVEPVPEKAAGRIVGRRVMIFKPSFGIGTPWAYGRMIARGGDYLPPAEVETRLAAWLRGNAALEELLLNNMEPAAFEKFIALPLVLGGLRREFGVAVQMSGSGSACFALLRDNQDELRMADFIRERWSAAATIVVTKLGGEH